MTANERRRLAELAVLPRLVALLGEERTVNGTRLAHAVATIAAQEIDQTQSTRLPADRRVALVDDATLASIAGHVRHAIEASYGQRAVLPSGTQIVSHRIGSIKYGGRLANGRHTGGRQYALSRARDGLFLDEDMPDDAEVVDALRRAIVRAVAPVRARDVPPLRIQDVVVDRPNRWTTRIVMPVRSHPGVTVSTPFTTKRRIDMMTDAEWHGTIADHVAREAAIVAKAAKSDPNTIVYDTIARDIVDKAKALGLDVHLEGIRVHPNGMHGSGKIERQAVLRVLGNGLRPEEWTVGVTGSSQTARDSFAKAITNQMGVQRRRQRRLAEAAAHGASGTVDTITLAALRGAAKPAEDVLREVVERGKALVDLPGHGHMRLSWRDGVVHSSFDISPEVRWTYGMLVVKNRTFPESVLQAIIGLPISAVVDHEFMDGRATVRSIGRNMGNWTRINVAVASVPFDKDTGRPIEQTPGA